MGGAIAIRVAAEQSIPSLIGLVVIDVVEGRYVCVCVCVCVGTPCALCYGVWLVVGHPL